MWGWKWGWRMARITDVKARSIKPGDKPIADGAVPGLRLWPSKARGHEKSWGYGKWILRFQSPVTNTRRDMGLGTYPATTIAMVRDLGTAARRLIDKGLDPINEREAERAAKVAARDAMTFEKAARKVHDEQKPGWKNPKHADQWINTLETYAFPSIGKSKVADLGVKDFAEVLRPIWLTKPETATRVKQRCHAVMKWCCAHGSVTGNPVDVVTELLPKQPGKAVRVQHHPSMPWRLVPAFVTASLRGDAPGVARSALEFLILTAGRSDEVRSITWSEVDLEAKIWTVPASRMKARVAHRVPLSTRAVEILEAQRAAHPETELVFPAPTGAALWDMALTQFLRDEKATSDTPDRFATAHGFRSSFRDWASEQGYSRDVAERALAHAIKDETEAAYHRTDLLDQRRIVMEAWAKHICSKGIAETNVVSIRASA